LLTKIGSEVDVDPESVVIVVLEMDLENKKEEQFSFPPDGLRISKVV
jgi:hypothetical protein